MQRFDSVYEIVICIRSQKVTQHVSLSDIFVASGNVSISTPVVRYTFDRIVQPDGNHTDEGTVWFDVWWAKYTVEGTVSPADEPDVPSPRSNQRRRMTSSLTARREKGGVVLFTAALAAMASTHVVCCFVCTATGPSSSA